MKCKHHDLGYMAFVSDSERRHKQGERQVYCTKCRLWFWPDHVCEVHRGDCLTQAGFNALVKRTEMEVARLDAAMSSAAVEGA